MPGLTAKPFKAFLLAASGAGLIAASADATARPRLTPEEQLAKELEGRVAGKPVDCIYMPTVRSSRIIDKTAIVYDAGSVKYVNRPRAGASSLSDYNTVLFTDLRTSQLCSIDIVRLLDQTNFFFRGFVNLGEFVPYTRVKPN